MLIKYCETPIFTGETVPAKLTREHNTQAGVWGRLVILEGTLDYIVPSMPEESRNLSKGESGIIELQVIHFVTPQKGTAFRAEFYKKG